VRLGIILTLLKETGIAWYEDRGGRLGAALAFYTLFSLAPLLIIVIAIAAVGFGREIAYTQLIQQIEAFIGTEGARVIQATIENTSRPSSGIMATLIGLSTMLFGATDWRPAPDLDHREHHAQRHDADFR
jgi:membrane protein